MWIPPWPHFLREFFPVELPKAYPRRESEDFEAKKEIILPLIESVSKEMESNRSRQVRVFREALIVIGILTWAVISGLEIRSAAPWIRAVIGSVTAVVCMTAAMISWYIIFLLRQRIYHLRKRREELASYLRPDWEDEKPGSDDNRATWLFPPIGPPVSSVAFAWMLPIVGLAAAALNVVAIWITDASAQ